MQIKKNFVHENLGRGALKTMCSYTVLQNVMCNLYAIYKYFYQAVVRQSAMKADDDFSKVTQM